MTLKSDQGQTNWYESIMLNVGYHYAKFERFHLKLNILGAKVIIKASAESKNASVISFILVQIS